MAPKISGQLKNFGLHTESGGPFFYPPRGRKETVGSPAKLKVSRHGSENHEIWRFFGGFEGRGAGQDRKGRRFLLAPGCPGAGFPWWVPVVALAVLFSRCLGVKSHFFGPRRH
jgi:hypothetical protein